MEIEVSIGEIVDKLSILKIKQDSIDDKDKLLNVTKEYSYLYKVVFENLKIEQEDFFNLIIINKQLWDIEDKIRVKEKNREFDDEFIQLARLVYIVNDKRADLKKEVNLKYGSKFIEEKSYEKY